MINCNNLMEMLNDPNSWDGITLKYPNASGKKYAILSGMDEDGYGIFDIYDKCAGYCICRIKPIITKDPRSQNEVFELSNNTQSGEYVYASNKAIANEDLIEPFKRLYNEYKNGCAAINGNFFKSMEKFCFEFPVNLYHYIYQYQREYAQACFFEGYQEIEKVHKESK